jgi:rubrerythrin
MLILSGALGLAAMLTYPAPAEEPAPAPLDTVTASISEPARTVSTLDNLLEAYKGESNAHVRYLAFAKKADAEGYFQVASLFRAVARAEEIHAANHAKVIIRLGGTPVPDLRTPEVKSTKENLVSAVEGETYEMNVMYPRMLEQAQQENDVAAARTFKFSKSVEIEHASLYSEALSNLAAWKTGPKDFYVCPVCGRTVMKTDFTICPICATVRERFEKVS